eukprot:1478883-Pyramimonas_sp.AAC.1
MGPNIRKCLQVAHFERGFKDVAMCVSWMHLTMVRAAGLRLVAAIMKVGFNPGGSSDSRVQWIARGLFGELLKAM